MGVVTASSSAARTLVGSCSKHSTQRIGTGRSLVVAFKSDKPSDTAIVVPQEKVILPVEATKRKRRPRKNSIHADGQTCPLDVDYNEAAAKLESIYKLSPAPASSDVEEEMSGFVRIGRQGKRSIDVDEEKAERKRRKPIIRNLTKKPRRLGLRKRLELKQNKETLAEAVMATNKMGGEMDEQEKIQDLVRGYYSSDLVAMDWSTTKIPPVLSSTEQAWLFKLVQPMKAILQAKQELTKKLGKEPTDAELAYSRQVNVSEVRKQMEVGWAARNKLIKHNLRLVLYMINLRFSNIANRLRFQDLCQAGAKGLITAIDRFEPSRSSKLSTYSLFWIRHAIIRYLTVANSIRVSFGLEVKSKIHKAKMELRSSLQRWPTEDEIIQKVGITRKRYNEVTNAFKPIYSLNSRHAVTQEELIDGVADTDRGHMGRQQALFRLALDDVLDSLKPKESLVIRQRFGLDGKGDRTLQEIAGNLNISREMVRKYEVKALMKLKHPARLDYLRPYVA